MKKPLLVGLGVSMVILLSVITIRFSSPEDTWLCTDAGWVTHGNPSAPKPETPCGAPKEVLTTEAAEVVATWTKSGHLVKNNPGMKPGVWFLIYEAPGQPALSQELLFTTESVCTMHNTEGVCPDVLLPSSALTQISGVEEGEAIRVLTASTGTAE